MKLRRIFSLFLFALSFFALLPSELWAQAPMGLDTLIKPNALSGSVSVLVSMATIGLIPFFLVSTTAFLRIVVVLSMTRMALATQQSPPNSVIISLALFLTIFVMTPTWNDIYVNNVQPYQAGTLTQKEALEGGGKTLKHFMLKYAREKDLVLFLEFSKVKITQNRDDIPIFVVIPAYIISELKSAFQIGFLLFIPFLVVDLIISNILLSLGMFMLSPAMISLPFKILLFVLADGWNLLIKGLLLSFQ